MHFAQILQRYGMKLVSLNLWGGRAFAPLMKFLREQSRDTDIFCFPEAFHSNSGIEMSRDTRTNLFADLATLLKGFDSFVAPIGDGYDNHGPVDFDITESNAIFVQRSAILKIDVSGEIFLRGVRRRLEGHESIDDIPYNFQYVRFAHHGKMFEVANIHGIARPGHKLDTPERIRQSGVIEKFLEGEKGAKIFCGDFNLLPDTQSIAMIEAAGMANLIKKFEIERTRSWLSPYFEKDNFQKFADYTFVSPDVRVKSFSVPDVAVSDHLPMILEFS